MVYNNNGRNALTPRQVPQTIHTPSSPGLPNIKSTQHAHPQGGRRSQSSMRPAHNNNLPPTIYARSASTGRAQDYTQVVRTSDSAIDDPDEVTRAIIDLRKNRKKNSTGGTGRSTSRGPSGLPRSISYVGSDLQLPHSNSSASSQQENRNIYGYSSKGKPGDSSPRSNPSQDSSQENARLRQAEAKIDGLMQELEDLKFFQELEEVTDDFPKKGPSPMNQSSPRHNRDAQHHHQKNTSWTPSSSSPLQLQNHGEIQHSSSMPMIPTVIRAPSPQSRGGRLPPPPRVEGARVDNDDDYDDEETKISLSPRRISRLDRTSLELETQTLIRKIQVLQKEKRGLKSTIQSYRTSMQEQHDASEELERIKSESSQLKAQLSQVQAQLHLAKQEQEHAQHRVVSDYRMRLEGAATVQETLQQKLVEMQKERDKAHQLLAKTQKEHAEKRSQWQNEMLNERESFQARESVLEMQLSETTNELKNLRRECDEKEQETEALRGELKDSISLQRNLEKDSHSRLKEELAKTEQHYRDREGELIQRYEKEVERLTKQRDEQVQLVSEKDDKLKAVFSDYKVKFEELRDTFDNKENRLRSELSESHALEVTEYKKELEYLKEQLKIATDRHAFELRQKETAAIRERDSLQLEMEAEFQAEKEQLQTSIIKLETDLRISEEYRRKLQTEIDARPDFGAMEHKEQLQLNEIERLREVNSSMSREMEKHQLKVADLSRELADNESKYQAKLRKFDTWHLEQIQSHEAKALERIIELQSSEEALRKDMENRENDWNDRKIDLETRISDLEQQLEKSKAAMLETRLSLRRSSDSKLEEMEEIKSANEQLKRVFEDEKQNHESICSSLRVELAAFEQKLKAAEQQAAKYESEAFAQQEKLKKSELKLETLESKLQQKRDRIIELQDKLRVVSEQSVAHASDSQIELSKLKSEMTDMNSKYEIQRQDLEGKADELLKKKEEVLQLMKKVDRLEELEQELIETKELLNKAEKEKVEHVLEINKIQKEYEEALDRLNDISEKADEHSHLAAELQLRDKQVNDVNERFASTLRELQEKLEEERRAKETLIERLGDTQADLELKEHQLTRLPKLQAQLKDLIRGREDLQAQLGRVEGELERKVRQLDRSTKKYNATVDEFKDKVESHTASKLALQERVRALESELNSKSGMSERQVELIERNKELSDKNQEFQLKLEKTELDLRICRKKLLEAENEFPIELHTKVEELTKTKAILETKLQSAEEELEEREKYFRDSSEKHSKEMSEVRKQLRESLEAKEFLQSKLNETITQLSQKTDFISATSSQYSDDVTDLQLKLSRQLEEKQELREKIDFLEERLREKERELTAVQVDQQSKLDEAMKDRRALRLKVESAEKAVESKEKRIVDMTDRHTREITCLEKQVAEQSKTISQLEDSRRRSEAAKISESNSDIAGLKERVASLEKSLEIERSLCIDAGKTKKRIEEKLQEVEKAKMELEDKFLKTSNERSEVINALEEVINEVQSREEEIENLASLLRKREEELDHAKVIATKALASAQEIKSRVKDRENNSELSARIVELNKMVDFVTGKNEDLQKKIVLLEREIHDRKVECSALKEKLQIAEFKQKGEKGSEEKPAKSRSNGFGFDRDTFQPLETSFDPHGFDTFAKFDDTASTKLEQIESMSTNSADFGHTNDWLNDFDGSSIESGPSQSRPEAIVSDERRSIERDALRKYIRKRYLKSKAMNSTQSNHNG
ncbi:hypothetical protein FisN_2Lh482 [Fistulifera solaris]|uniref:Uncharacterized protein n=1 Tax=Fistulifera solaris TaxID=1519565 RepID=A0A1Z5JAN0_FISSO|nr:hypothetical protein FisN_2Lh482 [Fistulifera solaris]|eukprot:GAX10952.1 hypothetical protein FisN_2Lh482 [Fistulifera solaris]